MNLFFELNSQESLDKSSYSWKKYKNMVSPVLWVDGLFLYIYSSRSTGEIDNLLRELSNSLTSKMIKFTHNYLISLLARRFRIPKRSVVLASKIIKNKSATDEEVKSWIRFRILEQLDFEREIASEKFKKIIDEYKKTLKSQEIFLSPITVKGIPQSKTNQKAIQNVIENYESILHKQENAFSKKLEEFVLAKNYSFLDFLSDSPRNVFEKVKAIKADKVLRYDQKKKHVEEQENLRRSILAERYVRLILIKHFNLKESDIEIPDGTSTRPYDFKVLKQNGKYDYFEVKSTVKKSLIFYLTANEYNFWKECRDKGDEYHLFAVKENFLDKEIDFSNIKFYRNVIFTTETPKENCNEIFLVSNSFVGRIF